MRALAISSLVILTTAALAACRADYPAGSIVDPHYAQPAPDVHYAPPAVQGPSYAPMPAPSASGPPIIITQPTR
jgi:hypothetical protein